MYVALQRLRSCCSVRSLSPWFLYQAIRYRKYIGSLAQRMGYLPVSFNLDGDESIWIHAVSVGEVADGARAARRAARALSEPAPLPVDDDDDRPAGRAAQPPATSTRVFYFPVRPAAHRPPDAAAGAAAAVRHDGDRDLAEPAARVPRARRQDGARQRPDLVALVSRATGWRAPFFRRVLADVDRFCMQSEESARRIIDIGADPATRRR